MKILYIGHYKENSGWSQAAIDNILALDSCGFDVACRNFKLTVEDSRNVPERILELERKDIDDADYCIQHVLPHHLVGSDLYKKNIAYYVHETKYFKNHLWATYLSLVDEVWVPNDDNLEALKGANLKNVKVVPHTFDLSAYSKEYEPINLAPNDFKFYYLGDFDDRKNIKSIVKSFYSEFDYSEPVKLILKIKKNHQDTQQTGMQFDAYIKDIKNKLRIYNNIALYNKDLTITDDLSRNDVLRVHSECDCFINTSHGEGWSIPSFEAMCFGNTPICTNFAGPKQFIDKDDINTGSLINGCWSICEHSNPPFKEIWSGKEYWMIPDEQQIRESMRYYYENRNNIDRQAGLRRAENFSYKNIGTLMGNILENE